MKLSGRVPQISIVTGLSAGGGAYSPALTDWVVMTEQSSMFLTGPGVVREALGEDVDAEQLGGTRVHERNGVCHFVAADDVDAARPGARAARLPAEPPRPAACRARSRARAGGHDPGAIVPAEARSVYDVRDVIRALVDGGELLEISAGWARNLVTALARIDGRTVGVIANQPRYLGGVLDAAQLAEGRAVRQQVQLVRDPAAGAGRHARLHAGHQAGVGRRDPLRRDARARVRGSATCRA